MLTSNAHKKEIHMMLVWGWPEPYIFTRGVDGANVLECDFFNADHV